MVRRTSHNFETGEPLGNWTNTAGSPPPTDDVTNAVRYTGNYSKRYIIDSSDGVAVLNRDLWDRSAAGAWYGCCFAARVDDLTNTILRIDLISETSTDPAYMTIETQSDGSVDLIRSTGPGTTTATNASTATGLITAGTWHRYSLTMTCADPGGRLIFEIDGVERVNFTGDTLAGSGTPAVGWGWGLRIAAFAGASLDPIYIDDFDLYDEETSPLDVLAHMAVPPTAVTADNDGTIYGGAANAAEAVDDNPPDGADGFTLDAVNDRQGLTTWEVPAGLTIEGVQIVAAVGDQANGSGEFTAEADDGTTVETSATFPVSSDFTSREMLYMENDPSGGAWSVSSAAALDVVFDKVT